MFRDVRRTKNALGAEEAKELLRRCPRAALAVNGDDGYPYAIPINFYYDEGEGRIYFHTGRRGYKLEAIQASDKVCLTTWDEGYRDEGDWAYHVSSCVVFGRARVVTDRAVTEKKLRALALKYYPSAEEAEEEIRRGIAAVQMIAMDIEHITGKRVHEK